MTIALLRQVTETLARAWGAAPHPRARFRQRALLQERLRWLAVVSALAVLGWIAFEAAVLHGRELLAVAALRVALAAALLVLARYAGKLPPMAGLVALVVLEALAMAAMRAQLTDAAPDWLRVGYSLVPFVLVSQLAILPLAPLRMLVLAAPAFALVLLSPPAGGLSPAPSLLHGLWLMGLMLALAMWSGGAQYALLLRLLSARWDAAHDPMTGLPNRRALLYRLGVEFSRSMRIGAPLSLLMLDLDHFKGVNDRHGHACGDEVIRMTAAILESELRGADQAGRVGGEEFAVVLPDTALGEALQVAERIRSATERAHVVCGGATVRCTISLGVAQLADDASASGLLSRADQALYAAKTAGRNRVQRAGQR